MTDDELKRTLDRHLQLIKGLTQSARQQLDLMVILERRARALEDARAQTRKVGIS